MHCGNHILRNENDVIVNYDKIQDSVKKSQWHTYINKKKLNVGMQAYSMNNASRMNILHSS